MFLRLMEIVFGLKKNNIDITKSEMIEKKNIDMTKNEMIEKMLEEFIEQNPYADSFELAMYFYNKGIDSCK